MLLSASTTPSPTGPAPVTSTGPASSGGTMRLTNRTAWPEVPITSSSNGARLSSMSSGTGSRQFSGTATFFAGAPGPVPANQAGAFQAHLGIAALACRAAIAMQGDVDRAAPAVHG